MEDRVMTPLKLTSFDVWWPDPEEGPAQWRADVIYADGKVDVEFVTFRSRRANEEHPVAWIRSDVGRNFDEIRGLLQSFTVEEIVAAVEAVAESPHERWIDLDELMTRSAQVAAQ